MIELLGACTLLALAVFRLALLLTREDGPFDLFYKLRLQLGAYDYGEDGEPRTQAGKIFSCPYCVGVWLSALAVLVLILSPTLSLNGVWILVVWLALAGIQTLFQKLYDALTKHNGDA